MVGRCAYVAMSDGGGSEYPGMSGENCELGHAKKKGRVSRRKRNKNGARDRRERDTDDRKHGARKDARRMMWTVGSEYVVPKRAGDVSGRWERRLIRRYERKPAIAEGDEGYG